MINRDSANCQENFESFKSRILDECIRGSAIASDLLHLNLEFIEDTGFWEPNLALNWEVNRFHQTVKPHSFGAIAMFVQESGEYWQGKPMQPRLDEQKENRPIKYETVKGIGSRLYLPSISVSTWKRICERYHFNVEDIWLEDLKAALKQSPEALTGLFQEWIDCGHQQLQSTQNSPQEEKSGSILTGSVQSELLSKLQKSSQEDIQEPCSLTSINCPKIFASVLSDYIHRLPGNSKVPNFWNWVEKNAGGLCTPVEGAKKALALLSQGYIAIALTGVYGGHIKYDHEAQIKLKTPKLIPDLARFAVNGRGFNFSFDQDDRPQTRHYVRNALIELGGILEETGCNVSVVEWESSEGKGVDDLIAAHGSERFEQALKNAVPLKEWKTRKPSPTKAKGLQKDEKAIKDRERHIATRKGIFKDKYQQGLECDWQLKETEKRSIVHYSGYAPTFSIEQDTILLRGWLGAGKTEAILQSLLAGGWDKKQVVWLTTRNGLLRQTAIRARELGFEVYHYQDDVRLHKDLMRTGQRGIYFMAPDSLKEYATGDCEWVDIAAVGDEWKGIRGELGSKTASVLEFERLIREAKHVIACDAFLGNVDDSILKGYRGSDRLIMDQVAKKSSVPIKWLETRTSKGLIDLKQEGLVLAAIDQAIDQGVKERAAQNGNKVMTIAVDSIRQAKIAVRRLVHHGLRPLLVCGETPESNHEFMPRPDLALKEGFPIHVPTPWLEVCDALDNRSKEYIQSTSHTSEEGFDCLVFTPSAQSGLDVQTPFELGLCFATGILPPSQMLQMLGRARQCKEWWIAAPRNGVAPACTVPALDKAVVQKSNTMIEERLNGYKGRKLAPKSIGWMNWQSMTRQIESCYNTEYLRYLLEQCFEHVEEVVFETQGKKNFSYPALYRRMVAAIEREDSIACLEANLERGLKLISEERQPETNADVWAVKVAGQHTKYSKVVDRVRATYQEDSQEAKEGAIEAYTLWSKSRLEKIYHWVLARQEWTLDELRQTLEHNVLTPECKRVQMLANIKLYQVLDLEGFATGSHEETIFNETHFHLTSPKVQELWSKFEADEELRSLFSTVGNIELLWAAVRRAMGYFGFTSVAKNIRVKTGRMAPNGYYKGGKKRYSDSEVVRCSGWLPQSASGSKAFRERFNTYIEELTDRADRERQQWTEERRKRLEKGIPADEPPPMPKKREKPKPKRLPGQFEWNDRVIIMDGHFKGREAAIAAILTNNKTKEVSYECLISGCPKPRKFKPEQIQLSDLAS